MDGIARAPALTSRGASAQGLLACAIGARRFARLGAALGRSCCATIGELPRNIRVGFIEPVLALWRREGPRSGPATTRAPHA
jgi:hypothetical protein